MSRRLGLVRADGPQVREWPGQRQRHGSLVAGRNPATAKALATPVVTAVDVGELDEHKAEPPSPPPVTRAPRPRPPPDIDDGVELGAGDLVVGRSEWCPALSTGPTSAGRPARSRTTSSTRLCSLIT